MRESENWPGNYPNDLDQELDPIVVAQGMVISIEFTDFDIEYHSSCGYDYLMIEDGDGTVLMEKSCGTSLPANIRSKTNVVKLRFKTDDSEVRRGWRFMWSAVLPSECLKLSYFFLAVQNSSIGHLVPWSGTTNNQTLQSDPRDL